ncbi:MAG: transposase [Candidatus Marinimicrobia bacterium]|nr:transposase [Candidatus Neomarinimicrobiota bacterium]
MKGYDYSQPGAYFVTLCTQGRECLFGRIERKRMILNKAGKMIETWYRKLENKFFCVQCKEYIIMPEHMHFIIEIKKDPKKKSRKTQKTMYGQTYVSVRIKIKSPRCLPGT